MTSYFDHMGKVNNVVEDTIEFSLPPKRIEHVDSTTIVEVPDDRNAFMKAYNEAVRRQG